MVLRGFWAKSKISLFTTVEVLKVEKLGSIIGVADVAVKNGFD